MKTNTAKRQSFTDLTLSHCPPDWLPVTVVEASFPPKHAVAMKAALLELEKDGRIEVGLGGNPQRAQVRRTLAPAAKEKVELFDM